MDRMKFFIIFLTLALFASPSFAARQVLNESASPSSKGGLNSNFSKANANFVELYAADLLKANISCFDSESAFNGCFTLNWQQVDASGFNGNLATTDNTLQEIAQKVDDLLLGGGSFDEAGDYAPTGTWDFTGATVTGLPGTTYIAGTDISISGGAISLSWDKDYADLINTPSTTPLTASMVTGVFPGTGDCLGANGEKVACGSGGASAIADLTDWPSGLTATELGYLDGVTSDIQAQINALSAGSGGTVTVVTSDPYSDIACTGAKYNSANDRFFPCLGGYHVGYVGLTDFSNPTPATPTLTNRVIGTNGTTLTLTGSASLSIGAGGNGGFDVDCSTAGNGITATYASGAPGTDLVYTLGTAVNSGDTCDLDYIQPGDGIEATVGGADLASITSGVVTNNSTQSAGEGSTCSGYTVCQNFEGTGYDNSETWSTSGTANPDSTSPALRGSQTMSLAAGAYAYRNITAMTGDVSVHMIVQLSTISANTGQFIFGANTGGDTRFGVTLQTAGGLRGYHGNAGCDTAAGAIAANTPIHLWVDRTRGTGSNGTLALYVSSTRTKPGSAACSLSNGDGAFDIDRLVLYALGDTATKHYDQIMVKSSVIGSVVP